MRSALLRRHRLPNLSMRSALFAVSLSLLCACSHETAPASSVEPQPHATNDGNASPSPMVSLAAKPQDRKGSVEMYVGSGRFLNGKPTHQDKAEAGGQDDGITLNFVNADIHDVAKAVLGDFLKLNYQIDPGAQGNITLQTSQPLNSKAVLPVLEQALRLNGLALVQQDGIHKIVALSNATRLGNFQTNRTLQPGFGVSVVPLRFVAVAEMQRLIEPMTPSGSILQIDPAQNLMLISGSEQERRAILDEIAMFDVDWLSGMSFALFRPGSVSAKQLTAELGQIISGPDSPVGNLVRLVPIERMNAVLAISPQPRYLEILRTWIERLDKPNETTEQRLFVYRVQNGRATDLAGTLNKVLLGQGDQTPPGTPARGAGSAPSSQGAVAPPADTLAHNLGGVIPDTQNTPGFTQAGRDLLYGGTGGDDKAPRMRITADEVNNALLIMATNKEFDIIEAALRQLDASPQQVLLEASVAEVTLTNELKFGVQFFLQAGSKNSLTLSNGSSGTISASFPGLGYQFTNNGSIAGIISALDSLTHVEVLSSPQVLVLNNQTATLQVGDQVPVITQQSQSTLTTTTAVINSVQYQSTGVILKVTPRVNQGGMVMMDISQEVSSVSSTTSSGIDSPTISQRKISSTVAIHNGETVALGGLITSKKNKSNNGVPVLHNIPVIGSLFGTNDDQLSRTELLVLITPHVVESQQRAQSVTEELRNKLPSIREMMKPKAP